MSRAREIFVCGSVKDLDRDEETREPLFWSNQFGFCTLPDADVFTLKESKAFALPVGGVWVRLPEEGGR